MEKFSETVRLIDIYSGLLTANQRDIMDLYYNYDLSLAEIAHNKDITRQGVHDIIKRSEETMKKLDNRLNLAEKFQDVDNSLNIIDSRLKKVYSIIEDMDEESPALEILTSIRLDLQKIVRDLMR
ncbi:MAG: DNA-binding protein [Clostridiales bacterium]|nr:DNA-binding protein [Clostridiales bacterium]